MVNWQEIKTEYITTEASYRDLAKKYRVGESTLFARASKEKWVEQRKQHQSKTEAETLNAIISKQADRVSKLLSVSDMLLEKVKELLEADEAVRPTALKNISGVLRDIKEIQMIRPESDMREQEARIKKLQMESEGEEEKAPPTIVIEGLPEEYKA